MFNVFHLVRLQKPNEQIQTNVDFGHKNSPILGEFFLMIQNSHLKTLFNICHLVPFQKKLQNRFKEKFKIVEFGLKNGPFTQFWA